MRPGCLKSGARFFCALGVSAFALIGQTPPAPSSVDRLKHLSLEELSQIDVTTPSKTPVRAFQTPAAISVLTAEDIRRSGATSIPEALRLVPGVEVARIDSSKWSIGIRGFGSQLTRSVLVLIDGRTVYTSLYDGTYWEVQDTMMEDIDRIEVICGPGGTIWGPNAVNGVINIITKNTKDTHGTLVSAGGGNEEQGFLNARYGGGDGNGFDYRVYGKGFTRSPEDHSNGQNFDDWRSMQAGFRMDWARGGPNTFNVQGDIYDQADGESVSEETYAAPYSHVVNANEFLSGGNLMFRWERTISPDNSIQIQVYYDRANHREPIFADLRDTFDADFMQRFRLSSRQNISWGLGARIQPIRDTEIMTGIAPTAAERTDYLMTGFVQDEVALVPDRLSLTLGTKVLGTNLTTGADLQPSARLAWTPDDRHTVWAAFTHALRTPSDVEDNFDLLGYMGNVNGLPSFAVVDANKNFAPEQMNGYELGYRQLAGKKVSVSVSSFYNHYHDLLSEDILGVPFADADPEPTHLVLPLELGNGLLATTKGVEIAPEWRPTGFWRLRGSYSYLHMDVYRSPNAGTLANTATGIVGSSPGHEATIESGFDLSKALQLDLDVRYVSALPGPMVSAYWSGNARFGWQFNPHLELTLVGENLLQPAHFEYGGDPGALVGIKRSGYIKLTWSR